MNRLMHNLDTEPAVEDSFRPPIVVGIVVGTILLGVLTGFGISKLQTTTASENTKTGENKKEGTETVGIADKDTFSDEAEGVLRDGGIEGEGNFHLIRPGGESQTISLTSSTVDLSQFIGKKVRIWGQSLTPEKAGWFMDVGLVEPL